MSKRYSIVEVFYSPQGEGVRAGTMNVFVRFAGCNMECDDKPGPKSPGGFKCDTYFASGRPQTLEELAKWCGREAIAGIDPARSPAYAQVWPGGLDAACPLWLEPWLILTGGEPGLQVDREFIEFWHDRGVKLAIETNGSVALPADVDGTPLLDWVTVSPKVAEHAIEQLVADEVKYVVCDGMALPKTRVKAQHKLLSPRFDGNLLAQRHLDWCLKLVRENPDWRLSVQQHKAMMVR